MEVLEFVKAICLDIEADPSEVRDSIYKYRKIFNEENLEKCLLAADELCDWLLSKKLKPDCNKYYRYSCFKYHLCGDWIDQEIYQNIVSQADRRLLD